jgi:FtsZ-interacting cell division protein ZipA
MDTWLWIVIAAAVVVAIVLVAMWAAKRKQRTSHLQEGFGPEYDRTVEETGSRRKAESELTGREKRREKLDIRPLAPGARDRFADRWRIVQERFVDDPDGALDEAHELVVLVMSERGYPTDDFEQRAADVSVDHPQVAENYRAAHAVYQANEQGLAGTDDLRQAFVHYRSLFAELLDVEGDDRKEVRS